MKHILICTLLAAAPCPAATLASLWLFDDSTNLGRATVGNNLAIAGPVAPTWSATLMDDGSASQTGVITTPPTAAATRFTATHGIAGNGGGSFVNEYSIVVDLFSPAASRSSWRTIMQTNQTNANDADYFIRNTDDRLGVGSLTYSTTAIDETRWTRLVVTFDLGTAITTYLNGISIHQHSVGVIDGTFSLDPTVLFFTDNDGDNAPLNIGALAVYDGVLTAAEAAALGNAGAPIPEPSGLLLGLAALGLAGVRRRR